MALDVALNSVLRQCGKSGRNGERGSDGYEGLQESEDKFLICCLYDLQDEADAKVRAEVEEVVKQHGLGGAPEVKVDPAAAEEEERRQRREREREKEREREAEEKARKMRKELEATYRQVRLFSGEWGGGGCVLSMSEGRL